MQNPLSHTCARCHLQRVVALRCTLSLSYLHRMHTVLISPIVFVYPELKRRKSDNGGLDLDDLDLTRPPSCKIPMMPRSLQEKFEKEEGLKAYLSTNLEGRLALTAGEKLDHDARKHHSEICG
ncbi:uncharacterized protein LOC117178432 [Belonocnema kinseyi]|uniref:uncharacterized protein LOC117178432 n=1 Tax=Belonocnema kinseyi TaxID=2817044 RepID=UPI00143CE22A|nr:uncharacterized protein LOC117178432 [Belonocnema kinseyi]